TADSVRISLGGLHLSQVAIGLLGVLTITSEYGTGMIRATLAAVPQRRLMLAAKALVLAAATLTTGIAASFAAYAVFQALLPAPPAPPPPPPPPPRPCCPPSSALACPPAPSPCSASASAPSPAPAPEPWPSCSAPCSCPPSWSCCCRGPGRTPSAPPCR